MKFLAASAVVVIAMVIAPATNAQVRPSSSFQPMLPLSVEGTVVVALPGPDICHKQGFDACWAKYAAACHAAGGIVSTLQVSDTIGLLTCEKE